MTQDTETPTPEEVASFIKDGQKNFFNAKLSKEELDEEQLNKLQGGLVTGEDEEKETSDLPMPKNFEPEVPTVTSSHFQNQKLDKLVGRVTLSELDKDLYMKALLNDTPFITAVEPLRGVEVTIKSRTIQEDDVVFHCLCKEKDSGVIIGPETYFSRLQMFLASIQVIKIGKKDVSFACDLASPVEDLHAALVAHIDQHYRVMQAPKWNAVVAAVRLFEAKLKICNDNLRDENFWNTAGLD